MKMRFFTAVALAGAIALPVLADEKTEPMKPSKVVQAVQSNDVKDFFETAASAGMFEVEAGKLAEQRGTTPDVQKFGKQMVKDHTEVAAELKALADKKGVTLPAEMLKRHKMMFDSLKSEDDGEDFDQEFRDKMISSHKEAVSLFDQAARKSKDPDVKAFAAKHLAHLQDHGAKARALPDT